MSSSKPNIGSVHLVPKGAEPGPLPGRLHSGAHRKPKGTPAGGQFAATPRDEAETSLTRDADLDDLAGRAGRPPLGPSPTEYDPGWQDEASCLIGEMHDGEQAGFPAEAGRPVSVSCERNQAYNEFGAPVPGATRGAYVVHDGDDRFEFGFDNLKGTEGDAAWSAAGAAGGIAGGRY